MGPARWFLASKDELFPIKCKRFDFVDKGKCYFLLRWLVALANVALAKL